MNLIFRTIKGDELDGLRRLFPDTEEMWRKYRLSRQERLDRGEIRIYVLEEDGVFIGELTVNFVSHDLPTETIPGQRVYLQTFRLEEGRQGRGLGQKLLRFVLDDLEREGYTQFTIGVDKDNERAKHIYFKFGFTQAIDQGLGDELDPSDYTLYMRSL